MSSLWLQDNNRDDYPYILKINPVKEKNYFFEINSAPPTKLMTPFYY